MAMNQNNPLGLIGAGGVVIQPRSNFRCPTCGDNPKVAVMPGLPPGTPECIVTSAPGDLAPSLRCLLCWNRFWDKFTRRHAPELVPIADNVRYTDEHDPDEEVE